MIDFNKRNKYGQILLTARKKAGLTQSEVAKRAGLTKDAVSRYEIGKRAPTITMMMKILSACMKECYTADVLLDALQILVEEFQKVS